MMMMMMMREMETEWRKRLRIEICWVPFFPHLFFFFAGSGKIGREDDEGRDEKVG